jgi:hypothetical protein
VSLLSFIIILVVIGVILWLVNTKIPMDATIKQIITVVVLIAVLLYVLSAFGLMGNINAVRVPRVN